MVLNKSRLPDMNVPEATLNFIFEKLSVCLAEAQFRDIFGLLSWLSLQSKGRKVFFALSRPLFSFNECCLIPDPINCHFELVPKK